jgi:ribosomal protein S18 acetylase RimI-like enzyme
VAADSGAGGAAPRIVGFATGSRSLPRSPGLGDGEIETLYVLDDFRELGLGRRLMQAAASHLAGLGCRSAFCWVLRENPSRWFYGRLGGRRTAESVIHVGGEKVARTAFAWDPIDRLLQSQPEARDRESS